MSVPRTASSSSPADPPPGTTAARTGTAAGPTATAAPSIGGPAVAVDGADGARHTTPAAMTARAPGRGSASAPARPLVRELEDVVTRMRRHGPRPRLRVELDAVLAAWAAELATVHAGGPTGAQGPAPLPWVLDDRAPAWVSDLPAGVGPAWAVRAHPAVVLALDVARAGWTVSAPVHGDPTGDDVLVVRDHGAVRARIGTHRPLPLRLGDPRWDVATALDWVTVALSPVLDPAWDIDPATVLFAAYRAAGGTATPTRAIAVARTLTTALEWSVQLAVLGSPDAAELAWLRGLWTRPLELAGAVPRQAVGRRQGARS